MSTTTQERPCTIEDITVLQEVTAAEIYTVDKDGQPDGYMDYVDGYEVQAGAIIGYRCGNHYTYHEFKTWNEAKAHLAEVQQ